MDFPHGTTVYRDRRPQIPNPVRPGDTIAGDWAEATTVTILRAFVGPPSTASRQDATRTASTATAALYVTDPIADIQIGDRIRCAAGTFYVNELPSALVNPFTGWQPAKEIPLDTTLG